jgi:mannose-6-phosphate isomerase-like protein (cupin superfamily)
MAGAYVAIPRSGDGQRGVAHPKVDAMTNLTTSAALHVDPDRLPVLDHLDFLCRVLLPGSATAGAFSIVEERARLGCMTPRHVHARESETFLVLDGAIEAWSDGATHRVEEGQLVHLPAGREHAFRVASATAHFYTLITPAGFEDFFPASGRVLDQGFDGDLPVPQPPPAEAVALLREVLAPFGCTISGPPPFAPPEPAA